MSIKSWDQYAMRLFCGIADRRGLIGDTLFGEASRNLPAQQAIALSYLELGPDMNHAISIAFRASPLKTRGLWKSCSAIDAGPSPLAQSGASYLRRQPLVTSAAITDRSSGVLRIKRLLLGLDAKHLKSLTLLPFAFTTVNATFSQTSFYSKRAPSSRRPKHSEPPNSRADDQTQIRRLSPNEVKAILGPNIDTTLANQILQVLQERRLAGTLEDNGPYPHHATAFAKDVETRALEWLRANYAVDEDAAVRARIEQEERELREKLTADAERLGIYRPQQGAEEGKPHGESGLDSIREYYLDKPVKQSRATRSQAQEIRDNIGSLQKAGNRTELTRSETPQWVQYYRERALLTPEKEIPNLSSWQRLYPSIIVASLVVTFSILIAQNYTPPSRSARLWPDIPPAAATVLGIILLNSAVLVAWRIPPLWRSLNKYFMSVPGYPYALSVVGNMFSHQQPTHFLMNMAVLWFIGTKFHDDVGGRGNFLAIYLSSGAIASVVSLASFVLRKNFVTSSLGASGAIAGVVAAWCAINSDKQFSLVFLPPDWLPPLSSTMLIGGMLAVEVVGILRGWSRVDHWAHLGGYGAGLAGVAFLKRGDFRRRRERIMSEKRKKERETWVDKIRNGRW